MKKNHDKCHLILNTLKDATQSAFTCLKLTIETLEQGVKYVQKYVFKHFLFL